MEATTLQLESLGHEELLSVSASLDLRVRKLEELVSILSRGKYMWESTFDAITAPVQIVTPEYEVMRANLSLAAVSKRDIASVVGGRCFEVFAGRNSPCDGCPMKSSLTDNAQRISHIGCLIGRREFEACAYPLRGGGKDAVVIYYRDVTEERRLQREVIQQEKMAAIGMLAGGVAHEINNPLGGILAFVQLMKRDTKELPSLHSDLEEVERAAIRCKKIVSDLLDFSRVSKDRERCSMEINSLLERVFPFIQREMRSMNIEFEFIPGTDMPRVEGIPDRLQQVFVNLMTNACQAMPQGGKLTVATSIEKHGELVAVRVKDTGSGISPEIKERIFDPFFTTKEPGKGTGLGLSISYRIIKDHGGEIICNDIGPAGTEFVVCLPAVITKEDAV